jgi:tryptophan-rich sensory protein
MRPSGDIAALLVAVIGSEAVGGLSAVAAGGDFVGYYQRLRKPPFTPPPTAFGPVWTALYLLMGVAAWLVWREGLAQRTALALGLFAAQLALNFAWSLIFFGQHRVGAALIEIAVLWLTILATIVAFWSLRPLAGALLVPYLAWVSVATYLNAGIWRLNRLAAEPTGR